MSRDFDVVLFGPTGVTGREVARHLARRAPALGLRWAVAGRDRARIDAVLAAVGATPDAVLHADLAEAASIDAMAASATVVANLVGPYAEYGEPVVAACVRHGTHQLDLTGELDWVRAMLDRYGDAAVASAAKIVPTAGFEALPFDLGALLAATTAHRGSGEPVVRVDAAVAMRGDARPRGLADVVSGGTYGSMLGLIRRGTGRDLADAHLLDPPGPGAAPTAARIGLRPRRHEGTGAWLSPMFPAAFLNPAVVHRTAALLRAEGDPVFAPSYRYREGTAVDPMLPGPLRPVVGPLVAAGLGSTQAALGLVGALPAGARQRVADVLARVGPKPGEGPRPETLDRWGYRIDLRATTTGGRHADAVVEAEGHPGYKSTATMLGEAALLLADPAARVPDRRGFLTPATALGLDELGRFAEAGVTFTVTG
jgi:short subunit dehydrogenase-like uncharacterized protein